MTTPKPLTPGAMIPKLIHFVQMVWWNWGAPSRPKKFFRNLCGVWPVFDD